LPNLFSETALKIEEKRATTGSQTIGSHSTGKGTPQEWKREKNFHLASIARRLITETLGAGSKTSSVEDAKNSATCKNFARKLKLQELHKLKMMLRRRKKSNYLW
jgi:hypothetical protein